MNSFCTEERYLTQTKFIRYYNRNVYRIMENNSMLHCHCAFCVTAIVCSRAILALVRAFSSLMNPYVVNQTNTSTSFDVYQAIFKVVIAFFSEICWSRIKRRSVSFLAQECACMHGEGYLLFFKMSLQVDTMCVLTVIKNAINISRLSFTNIFLVE